MALIIDSHVHFYKNYTLENALQEAFDRCQKLLRSLNMKEKNTCSASQSSQVLLCLTERFDCHFFSSLKIGRGLSDNFSVKQTKDENCLRLELSSGGVIFILAGRQVVTTERLEILALGTNSPIADGKSLEDVKKQIADLGGLFVINWAPGKWFFKRGKLVRELIESSSPDELFICDTSLRPRGWPTPYLMKFASNRGFRVLAGSDPLPLNEEEKQIGRYGMVTLQNLNEDHPATSFFNMLRDSNCKFYISGTRRSFAQVFLNVARHMANK